MGELEEGVERDKLLVPREMSTQAVGRSVTEKPFSPFLSTVSVGEGGAQ